MTEPKKPKTAAHKRQTWDEHTTLPPELQAIKKWLASQPRPKK